MFALLSQIKPIAYELEGILQLMRKAKSKSDQGYLIESLWKFLLFTELAKSVYEELAHRPTYVGRTNQETELVDFIDANSSILMGEFSIRLESAVARLESLEIGVSTESRRLKTSELLHSEILARLRSVLGAVLHHKQKVAILVDNLDKAWDQRSDLSALSELLFGLLGVSGRISQEFERSGFKRLPVNVTLTLFLRSDIYAQVSSFAKEKDKLPVRFITWDDEALLLSVVEDRFAGSSSGEIRKPDEIWPRFFCPDVQGVPIKKFIVSAILPRPRDLVFFVRSALDHAVNAGHALIQDDDLMHAEKQYSRYALDSLVVEGATEIDCLEELLYELAGASEILGFEAIAHAVSKVDSSRDPTTVVDTLVDLAFLGVEVMSGRFEFLSNEVDQPKFRAMARRLNSDPKTARYRVARPFHAYLEISRNLRLSFGDAT